MMDSTKFKYGKVIKYNGPIKAVIFDWAGTVVDCGVMSPTSTFRHIFAGDNVEITESEARGPMGIHKRDHIKAILAMEEVRNRWIKIKRKPPTDVDVQRLYESFTPVQVKSVVNYAKPITGVLECIAWLRSRGIVIGSCTGYTLSIVNALKVVAAEHGYKPDCYVTADEVDDTVDGIREGIAAGCWAVGVAKTGNYVGCDEDQLLTIKPAELKIRLDRAYDLLKDSGAHYVIDSTADLPKVIEHIEQRLVLGEKP